jgi:hypothetical protein
VPDQPLIRKVDCLQVPVPNLHDGLAFYCDGLGHTLIWRTPTAAGLRMPESDTEIVIQAERLELEDSRLVLLDLSTGMLQVDAERNVIDHNP